MCGYYTPTGAKYNGAVPLNGRSAGVRAAAAVALGCAIASVALFWDALAGRALMAGLDFRALFYPFLGYAQRMFRETGALPLWLPHLFGGVPFVASMNASVLYPTEIPAWVLGIPAPAFHAWDAVVHQAVAGAGAAALFSFEGLGFGAAFFGGIVFAFGGLTVTQLGVATVAFYRGVTLLPWLVVGVRAARDGRRWGIPVAGAAFGLMFLTFAAQMLAFSVVWVVLLLALDSRRRVGRSAAAVAGALAAGCALGAAWLFPAAEYFAHCVRSAPGAGFSLQWRFSAAQLVEMCWPGFWGRVAYASDTVYFGPHGSDMTTIYAGLVPVAFAAAGVAAAWRRRWPWLVAGLVAFVWSFGPQSPLGRPLLAIPGFDGFRGWSRWTHFAELVLALFAAEGWRAFRETGRGRRIALGVLVLLAAATLAAWAVRGRVAGAVLASPYVARHSSDPAFSRPAVARTVRAALARAAVAGPGSLAVVALAAVVPGPAGLAAVSLWTLADLVQAARPYMDIGLAARFRIGDAAGDFLASRRGVFRTVTDEDPASVNWRIARDLEFLSGHHAVPPREIFLFAEAAARSGDPRRFQALLNVRFHVSAVRAGAAGLRLVAARRDQWGRDVFIHEDPAALPRVFFARWGRAVPDFATALGALLRPGWSWREAAVEGFPAPVAVWGEGRVTGLDRGPGRLSARVEAAGPAFAVVSETAYPGWRAFVDGNRTRTWRVDALVMGIEVPAGRHELRMVYAPPVFSLGLFLSVFSFVALAAGGIAHLAFPRS